MSGHDDCTIPHSTSAAILSPCSKLAHTHLFLCRSGCGRRSGAARGTAIQTTLALPFRIQNGSAARIWPQSCSHLCSSAGGISMRDAPQRHRARRLESATTGGRKAGRASCRTRSWMEVAGRAANILMNGPSRMGVSLRLIPEVEVQPGLERPSAQRKTIPTANGFRGAPGHQASA